MEIKPLVLPNDKVPSATLSMLIRIMVQNEVLSAKIESVSKNEPLMPPDLYNTLSKNLYDQLEAQILVQFGE
jgi:hypothetical protein